ncbi:peptidyl-prolyl cis-trans isomerase [Polaribacter sp. BAL334]|uniref:peptidylprolyl isomerase n=1 Tax=Polaribacter sp. BAL334 TaxID=1708178 RepID=UPI0018D255F9|nr:peptidylprolyl isomerase [Polaribacter sp. BAL334]MBG7613263.1 peptidyl-prolyl cis-trans isomerase [Polaribacter sp. BAL334]
MKKRLLIALLSVSSIAFSQKKDKLLLTIGNEKVLVSDFMRVYEKNLDAIENEEEKDIQKNIELYINYRLKVKEAYRLQLDTLPSYKKEIETYRNQLSLPYLQDSSFINKLVEDAYFRIKNEVKAKHILVRTPAVATPKDTLEAYTKIKNIREKILKGEDFEKVAVEFSEDPSAKGDPASGREGNKGNLGYFSAFRMVFPFEDAAYKTKVGEVSTPFKTRFGYHILQVDSIRLSKGEVEVAHILITDKTEKGEKLINEVYDKLQKDEQFKTLARKYSDDEGTKSKGGVLRKFGTGVMVKEFEDAAFSLEKEESYSKPFQSRFGWHIVQLIKKHPIDSFENLKADLLQKVRSDERAQLSQMAVIQKLRKKYSITENQNAKSILDAKNIRTIAKDSLQDEILKINERSISQEKFVNYIKNKSGKAVFELYEDFKNEEILNYYKENLEKSAPEFATTLQEYKDGLLLFELMQQTIWEKSTKDSLGLKTFFDENVSKYSSTELSKVKGEVMNDYQNFLENNWIAELRKNVIIAIDNRQLKNLIKFYTKK